MSKTKPDLSNAVVDALVAAYNSHDAAAFANLFSVNAVAYEHPNQPAQIGRVGIQSFYTERFKALPELSTEILHRIVIGEYVIDHERVKRANSEIPFETLAINLIRDGLIQRLDIIR
jgi:hypothetical protein